MKKYTLSAFVTVSLLASSVSICALASATGLKVAVVENALGSNELVSGNIDSGLNKIVSAGKLKTFEQNIGLCAGYIKSSMAEKAKVSCTAAIESLTEYDKSESRIAYLTSVTYSNLAIAKYMSSDTLGAMTDSVEALLIDDNDITRHNLASIKKLARGLDNDKSPLSAE